MSSYLSILGISTIDNVQGNNVNVQNVNTNSISVSSLTSGLVSSNASGSLQNAIIGSGLNFSGNTLNNTGLTSITSGATGPVYISTSSTGSVHIALPQNLNTSSSPQFARLLDSSIGTFNVIQGTNAGNLFTGDRCVLIGDSVMSATSSSQQSTAIGNSALGFATGNFNTAVGANAGFVVTTGSINTILGTNAGRGATPLTTGSGNVLLGAGANTSSGSSTNEIVLGLGVGAGSNTAKIYASNGLNVSNLTNGVLKATSGTITSNSTTDDLTEGKTNLYYTDTRAQGAFSAGTGIDITSGVITNTGVTSITSGATGPIYISASSTGSVQIALPQNLTPTSGVEFFSVTTLGDVNSGGYLYSGALSGGGANNSLAVIDEGTVYSLNNIVAPIQYDWANGLRISLTGSTGIDYTVSGNTGYITNKNITGATGPMGVPGVGGTIGYYANYYSTTTQSIGTSAQQITFPNHFVQNGISLDVNNNIVFSASGTYKITTLLQVNGSNNAKFYHWYRYNGADVGNSAFEDNFSGSAAQVLSSSSGLITVNAGDTLGLWGVKTAGTINVTYTPSSVSPAYPASTSVNISVTQETYTQIGPTGYTGPIGPVYSAGTNIDISGGNVISTVTNPQFERVLNSSLGSTNLLLGTDSGSRLTSGGGNLLIGQNAGKAITTGTFNIGLGSSSYGGGGSMTLNSAQNVAIGNSAMFSATTSANNNVAIGYQTLQTLTDGYNNTAIGYQAGQAVAGGFRNTMIGYNSGYYVTTGNYNCGLGDTSLGGITTGSNNVAIGPNTLTGLTTGSNNVHIGTNTQSRIQNAQRAIVISAQTTTSVDRGDDTAFINCPRGLYYYNVATAYLTSTGLLFGRVVWANSETNNPINNITLANLGNGPNTVIQPNVPGLYQIDVSGTVLGGGGSIFGTWNNVNVRNYNTFLQSFSSVGIAYQMGFTVQSRPYSINIALSGFELQITGGTYYVGLPLTASVRFISI